MDQSIIQHLAGMSKSEFQKYIQQLDIAYHSEANPIVPDDVYDEIVSRYQAKFGPISAVGAKPTRGKLVSLPIFLGSLDKAKVNPDEAQTGEAQSRLTKFQTQYPGPYVVELKIDGLTGLYTGTQLFTRGDGSVGQDISGFISFLQLPPIPSSGQMVRGEIVMDHSVYQQYKLDHPDAGDARSVVSGIINSGTVPAYPLKFYAYQILGVESTPEHQLATLRKWGFLTPPAFGAPSLNLKQLTVVLQQQHTSAPFKIDGLVLVQNKYVPYPVGKRYPDSSIAFKVQERGLQTTVLDVQWNPSKDSLLFPTVFYQPVFHQGATLSKASGKSAEFIIKNGIGPGAVIEVARAGDVIPEIMSIISGVEPQLPDLDSAMYEWDGTQTNFRLKTPTDEVIVKQFEHFMKVMDVRDFGPARLALVVASGRKTIGAVFQMSIMDLSSLSRVGLSNADKIHSSLHSSLSRATLPQLMTASGVFGRNFGVHRTTAILESDPTILTETDPVQILDRVSKIDGMGPILSLQFTNRLPLFVEWMKTMPAISPRATPTATTRPTSVLAQTLDGKIIVVSGFRDASYKERLAQRGGQYSETGPTKRDKDRTIFVYDPAGKAGQSKMDKVVQLGLGPDQIVTRTQFEAQFLTSD